MGPGFATEVASPSAQPRVDAGGSRLPVPRTRCAEARYLLEEATPIEEKV
jgi:hypothetical protein